MTNFDEKKTGLFSFSLIEKTTPSHVYLDKDLSLLLGVGLPDIKDMLVGALNVAEQEGGTAEIGVDHHFVLVLNKHLEDGAVRNIEQLPLGIPDRIQGGPLDSGAVLVCKFMFIFIFGKEIRNESKYSPKWREAGKSGVS